MTARSSPSASLPNASSSPARLPEERLISVAVVGAGIAGLTVALALARDGHAVTVFEQAPALSEVGAGVQLSPNATRALRSLGVLDALRPHALRPTRVRVRRGRDGRDLAEVPLGDRAEARYGAPFLLARRAALQGALATALESCPGATLRLGCRLAGLSETPQGVEASFEDGSRWQGAALLGADGLHSRVRGSLTQGRADPLVPSGRTAWRCLVAGADAPAFAREPASALWLGSKTHLVHYPLRDGAIVNVVAVVGDARGDDRPGGDWARPGHAPDLAAAFAGWCPEARALLATAPGWRVWPLFTRAPLPAWARGRVAVLGDAAHPMLPFLAQGAAQGIEDGVAVAAALREARDVPAALQRFETQRRQRAERVVRVSAGQGTVYHLAGAPALARDTAFRLLGPARMLTRFDWLYGGGPAPQR